MLSFPETKKQRNRCPFEYGPAVYSTRAYLKKIGLPGIFENSCEFESTSNTRLISQQGNSGFSLIPNPAKNQFAISSESDLIFSEIVILSSAGLEVKRILNYQTNTPVLLEGFSGGLYLLKATSNSGIF
jgi:hypothetical protein